MNPGASAAADTKVTNGCSCVMVFITASYASMRPLRSLALTVICEELPMVVSNKLACNPDISEPINTCTDTPMAMPSAMSTVCPLLDVRNRHAILNASFISIPPERRDVLKGV
ncbi:hypothetical protein SDC9_136311 [bioreactor metagenome]|uniref:Uncharacterized protein n=1 Tax=bioreactor metagenome TaxID=1076179 RepID=A0A645DK47_9ZZZZ